MNRLLFIVFLCCFHNGISQSILLLKPGPVDGKDAHVLDGLPSLNVEPHDEFLVTAWTCQSNPCNSRQLIQFDLNSIPPTATILSAYLNLYANPTPVTIPSANYGTFNECHVRRITSPWQEDSVTWNNQPLTTSQGEIVLPHSSIANQDFFNINVTQLVKDMVASSNFGFYFQLTNENFYNGKNFVSSDHPDSTKWPELMVTYFDSLTCFEIKPDGLIGKDTHILSGLPANNVDPHPELLSIALTCGSNICTDRSLIEFDLSAVPNNAILLHAGLNLYANPTPVTIPQSNYGTDNSCMIQRITSPWIENTVTWNTQPTVTTQNQVIIPTASLSNQDFVDINVTAIVNDMLLNPQSSYGFSIKLINEIPFNGKDFASSDHADSSRWPSLTLCYTQIQNIEMNNEVNSFQVSPNPFQDKIKIILKEKINGPITIELTDISGRVVQKLMYHPLEYISDLEFFADRTLPKGMYIISVTDNEKHYTSKIIK